MFRTGRLFAGLVLAVSAIGCDRRPKEAVIEIKPSNDPLAAARRVLQRYADGQPLASEVTSFPRMVEEVRKVDPVNADILETGLAEIQKASPAALRAKARELLAKLPPPGT